MAPFDCREAAGDAVAFDGGGEASERESWSVGMAIA